MTETPPTTRKARRQTPKTRKMPERTCVACRQPRAKRQLIRLVRLPKGGVEIDATGKKSGRGAYLCRYGDCWQIGLDRRALDRALKTELTTENRQALTTFAAQLPPKPLAGRTEDHA